MQDSRVARRYAQAVYEIAVKYDVVASVEDDLTAVSSQIENDPEFRKFIIAPYTSRPEKIEIVEKIFSDRITAVSLELLRLMLSKGREREIVNVRAEYLNLRRHNTGTIHVQVSSAIEMTSQQKSALETKLASFTGNKIDAEYEVDATMIGGIKVAYNNNVIDGSVSGSLQKLRDQFRHDVLIQA